MDDTDYDGLELETGPSRSKAQNKKKVAEVIDVDRDSSEDDCLPHKVPPVKQQQKAESASVC